MDGESNLSRESGVSDVKVVETDRVELKEPLVILGFAGIGLIGGIAVTHIIEELKMKKIAHVHSKYMPPAVVFIDGQLRHPFRIYSDTEGKLCIVVCEIPLLSDGLYSIASTLLDWVEDKTAKELVFLDGFPADIIPEKRESYCVAEPEKRDECDMKGIKKIPAGIIHGIAGGILNECLTRKIMGMAFLTPALEFMPDPEGAAVLIDALNKVYGLQINTEKLLTKAEEIKQKLREVTQRHQQMRDAEEKKGVPELFYI